MIQYPQQVTRHTLSTPVAHNTTPLNGLGQGSTKLLESSSSPYGLGGEDVGVDSGGGVRLFEDWTGRSLTLGTYTTSPHQNSIQLRRTGGKLHTL